MLIMMATIIVMTVIMITHNNNKNNKNMNINRNINSKNLVDDNSKTIIITVTVDDNYRYVN